MSLATAHENSPILEMKGICKQFPGVAALQNVDLTIRQGEIHGLVGENSAGKSTLMKILSGAYLADSGDISIFGRPVTRHSPLHMLELGIAVIYQETMLAPHLTVGENLFLGRLPRSAFGIVDWAETVRRSVEIMSPLGFSVDPAARVMDLMAATFTYHFVAPEGVQYAYKIAKGEKLPKEIVLETKQADASNIDQFVGTGF